MSERAPAPAAPAAAVAAFLAWPTPADGTTDLMMPRHRVGGDAARASVIALALCVLIATLGMALPVALGAHGAGLGLRSHLSLFCHLL